MQAKKILIKKYTKGSWSSRFFSFSWGHNHISTVNSILKEDHFSLEDLINSLDKKLVKIVDAKGELMKCLYFILKKNKSAAGNKNNDLSRDELDYIKFSC